MLINAILRQVQMPSHDPGKSPSGLRHLQMLEAESISIIHEAVAECAAGDAVQEKRGGDWESVKLRC